MTDLDVRKAPSGLRRRSRRRLARLGRILALALAQSLPAASVPGRAAEPVSAVIFAYQHFGDDADPAGTIAVEQFEAHLQELRSGGYTVLPVPDIVAALRDGKKLPDHTVGITIDDAHVSAYTVAWPRLRAAGLPFTLFVSTETLEGGTARMTWDQLRELAAAGVTIGNQTASYPHMIEQDRTYNVGQILRAQDQLKAMLGEAPKLFAYPYGEYSAALRDLVAHMGFDAAFGLQSGVAYNQADRFALPRFTLNDAFGSLERFRLSADALPLLVSEVTPADGVADGNPPHFGFTVDPAMGELDQLACFASGLGRAQLEYVGGRRVEVRLSEPLASGRTRINCTLPGNDGRWRWFGAQLSIP
jgi:peptidoglycan/xylan/chitin deacetylase (PgdA/CDA1 family)